MRFQLLALEFGERVLSLVLISTSVAVSTDRELPPPTEEFTRFVSTVVVDWTDPRSVIDYLVDYSRVLAGTRRPFDEETLRDLFGREAGRARDLAAAQNHDLLPHGEGSPRPLSSITQPTVVVHGTADPMFPIEHGEALAAAIPGARLLRLEGAGHGVDRADWERIAAAILEHA